MEYALAWYDNCALQGRDMMDHDADQEPSESN